MNLILCHNIKKGDIGNMKLLEVAFINFSFTVDIYNLFLRYLHNSVFSLLHVQ